MTQSSGGTVKAPRLRRLSDQTALMVKGTSPELWRVLSFKVSNNWLINVLYMVTCCTIGYYGVMPFKRSDVRWNWLGATLEAPLRPNCAFPPSPQTGGGFCHQCVFRHQPDWIVDKTGFCYRPNMGRPILLLLSSLQFSSAFIVRAGLCPEYVRGMKTW